MTDQDPNATIHNKHWAQAQAIKLRKPDGSFETSANPDAIDPDQQADNGYLLDMIKALTKCMAIAGATTNQFRVMLAHNDPNSAALLFIAPNKNQYQMKILATREVAKQYPVEAIAQEAVLRFLELVERMRLAGWPKDVRAANGRN
jgi:hypothetical protein